MSASFTDSSSDDEYVSDVETEIERQACRERLSLKEEIMKLIRPYRYRSEEPPFSVGELSVMAVLCRDGESLSRSENLAWILKNFKPTAPRLWRITQRGRKSRLPL